MARRSESPPAAEAVRTYAVYPGGPTLYVPPDWTDQQIAEALAMFRRNLGMADEQQ